jgi:hypothetical protein
MDNIAAITTFLGWCTVINIGFYCVTAVTLTVFKDTIKTVHSKIAGVGSDSLDELYFQYLGHYKLAIIVLSLTPYLALRIMNS